MISADKRRVPKLTLIQGGKSLLSNHSSHHGKEKRTRRLRRPNSLNPCLIPIWHHLVRCPESKDWLTIDKEMLHVLAVNIYIYLGAKLDAARCDMATINGAREKRIYQKIMKTQSKFIAQLRANFGFTPYDDAMDGVDREFGYLSLH